MKPAETGCPVEQDQLQPQDSLFLRQISGCTAPQELITPYTLLEPLAPALAAEHEGRVIDLDHIVCCYHTLAREHDIMLVEGAGGLLVPLTEQENFLDLAARLDLPVLIVARNILGTINHTALTAIVASQRCRVAGIILNNLSATIEDVSQVSNAEALQRWGHAPLLGVLPYTQERTPENLLRQSEHLNISAILNHLALATNKEEQV
jgi:dethiobiotin synthetase